jgi:hypothetical protein
VSRLLLGALVGATVAIVTATALGLHAETLPSAEVTEKAQALGLNEWDLQGALNTTGYDLDTYLCLDGDAPCPKPPPPPPVPVLSGIEQRLACAVRWESHGNPNATNPRSGAAGLYQFLWSTWYAIPARITRGRSPYDPVAAHEAAVWLASQDNGRGFGRHWAADVALGC